jgi:hypothetical protein
MQQFKNDRAIFLSVYSYSFYAVNAGNIFTFLRGCVKCSILYKGDGAYYS